MAKGLTVGVRVGERMFAMVETSKRFTVKNVQGIYDKKKTAQQEKMGKRE